MPTNSNPSDIEQIRAAIDQACLKMPDDAAQRREIVVGYFSTIDAAKGAVKEAKQEAGLKDEEERLVKVFGVTRKTQQILKILDPMKPGDRAAVLSQIALLSQDLGYMDRDLVDLAKDTGATAGMGRDEQGSVFDKTSAGKAMGGEPRHMEPAAAVPEPAPTPAMDLAEAQRIFEENLAAYKAKGGRGRKPKALLEAEAAVTAAEKARTEQEHAAKAEPAAADDDFEDDIPEPTSRNPLAGATGTGTYTIG